MGHNSELAPGITAWSKNDRRRAAWLFTSDYWSWGCSWIWRGGLFRRLVLHALFQCLETLTYPFQLRQLFDPKISRAMKKMMSKYMG
jgi:hypothetical protein